MALESNEVVEQGPAPAPIKAASILCLMFPKVASALHDQARCDQLLRVFANDATALARAWPPPCLQAINDAEHAMPLARLMNSATLFEPLVGV